MRPDLPNYDRDLQKVLLEARRFWDAAVYYNPGIKPQEMKPDVRP
jgi:hypothetical protein